MATEKQINANRANALKSAGARTKTGQKKASRNALRHGLLARTIVLPDESRARFIALLTELEDEHNPTTATERWFVEKMAIARWRHLRCAGFEMQGLASETADLPPAAPQFPPDASAPVRRGARAFRALADTTHSLELINRYEGRFDRQFNSAVNQLQRFRQGKNHDFAKQTQLTTEESTT